MGGIGKHKKEETQLHFSLYLHKAFGGLVWWTNAGAGTQ
jgi:hypothetical protein